ncbi:hypothetical protein K9M79_02530 [Candidatus Woesearchaeota archaeon]|nr:hypothetical protein [Candidatus Woesearchaeota archaeon]
MNAILRYLSYILFISAFFRIIPIFSATYYGESLTPYLFGFLVTVTIATIIYIFSNFAKHKPLNTARAILLTALSFILIPLISSLSFLPYTNFVNALFESVSGFTTTGLSIFPSIDSLPKSLILWRATTQWIGGFGIILVFLYIFTRVRSSDENPNEKVSISYSLFKSQGLDKSEQSFRMTTQYLGLIYVSFTIIGIILLFISGLPLFDSIVISFGSISTGGFSVGDHFYSNPFQLAVISLIMVLGSISFVAHTKLVSLKLKEFFSNTELRLLLLLIAIFVFSSLIIFREFGIIIFQVISALTTTGYSTVNLTGLPLYFILILMLCMMIGGSTGSTSGGIKLNRFYILFKSIGWAIKKITLPSTAVFSFKIKEKTIDENNVFLIQVFFFTYLFLLFISTIAFLILGYSLMDSAFQVSSALGTVGLSTMPLDSVPIIGKVILMILMLFGRLEIFPLLILVKSLFNRDN